MSTKIALALLTLGMSLMGAEKKEDKPQKPHKQATVRRARVARRAVIVRAPLQTQGAIIRSAVAEETGAFLGSAIVNIIIAAVEGRGARREAALLQSEGSEAMRIENERHDAAVDLFLERERQKKRESEAAARALNPFSK